MPRAQSRRRRRLAFVVVVADAARQAAAVDSSTTSTSASSSSSSLPSPPSSRPRSLIGMPLGELELFVEGELGEPRARARHLYRWLYGGGGARVAGSSSENESEEAPSPPRPRPRPRPRPPSWADAPGPEQQYGFSFAFLAKLNPSPSLLDPGIELVGVRSAADGTRKLLFRLTNGPAEGKIVDAVLIPSCDPSSPSPGSPPPRLTLCVSSQAGCAMGCAFCLTGAQGLSGSLSAAQIVGQLVAARQLLQGGGGGRKREREGRRGGRGGRQESEEGDHQRGLHGLGGAAGQFGRGRRLGQGDDGPAGGEGGRQRQQQRRRRRRREEDSRSSEARRRRERQKIFSFSFFFFSFFFFRSSPFLRFEPVVPLPQPRHRLHRRPRPATPRARLLLRRPGRPFAARGKREHEGERRSGHGEARHARDEGGPGGALPS